MFGSTNAGGSGVLPTGEIEIILNGDYNVVNYATANVNVSGGAVSVDWSQISNKPSSFIPADHTHDERYYTETETNELFDDKLDKATPTDTKEYLYTYAGNTQYTNRALINDMTSGASAYTDQMVPTAKSVATALDNVVGNIESLLEALL